MKNFLIHLWRITNSTFFFIWRNCDMTKAFQILHSIFLTWSVCTATKISLNDKFLRVIMRECMSKDTCNNSVVYFTPNHRYEHSPTFQFSTVSWSEYQWIFLFFFLPYINQIIIVGRDPPESLSLNPGFTQDHPQIRPCVWERNLKSRKRLSTK